MFMRLALFALLVALPFGTARAQTAELPLSSDQARALSKDALAGLIFGAVAEQIVAVRTESVLMGDEAAQFTFLLKPQKAVDSYMVFYRGACSVRRVTVTLDMADGGRSVYDIETDKVWAVLGPMSVVEYSTDVVFAPGDRDPAEVAQEAACEAWRDLDRLVESPDAGTLHFATDALSALLEGKIARVTCDDDVVCAEPHWANLKRGRLASVGVCDDPEFVAFLGIAANENCFTLNLTLPGGGFSQFDSARVVAGGPSEYGEPFVPTRAWMGLSTTIVD